MIVWISAGFVLILVYALWLTARVAQRRDSALMGLLTGLIVAPVLWGIYLVVLARWARNQLREILEIYLPQIVERALELLQQMKLIGESL